MRAIGSRGNTYLIGHHKKKSSKIPKRTGANHEQLEDRRILAGGVVISELMYHPISGQTSDEWIELFNPGNEAIDLNGFTISRGVSYTFSDIQLNAQEYLVVASNLESLGLGLSI